MNQHIDRFFEKAWNLESLIKKYIKDCCCLNIYECANDYLKGKKPLFIRGDLIDTTERCFPPDGYRSF